MRSTIIDGDNICEAKEKQTLDVRIESWIRNTVALKVCRNTTFDPDAISSAIAIVKNHVGKQSPGILEQLF